MWTRYEHRPPRLPVITIENKFFEIKGKKSLKLFKISRKISQNVTCKCYQITQSRLKR